MPDDDEDTFVDSGPFCKHWSDEECSEVCAECGHSCNHHGWGFGPCSECGCKKFVDE